MSASEDRPRRTRAERRQRLLAQALQLFAEQGYTATSTAQIASSAGVRESLLIRMYPSKSDLFRDLLDEMLTNTLRAWHDETATIADPHARLHALAERYLESIRGHSTAFRAISRLLTECPDDEVQSSLRAFALEWEDCLAGLITQGQQAGFFRRSLDPRVGAWQLLHSALAGALTRPLAVPLHEQKDYPTQAIECAFQSLLKTDV